MKIGVFYPRTNQEHLDALGPFFKGLRAAGEQNIQAVPIEDYKPGMFDVAVIFGVYKKDVPISNFRKRVLDGQVRFNKDTIVLEKGYLRRDRYYAVGVNGLNGRANFNNVDMPPDRFNDLHISIKRWRKEGKHIILGSQVPSDASVQNVDIFLWCVEAVRTLKLSTNREIIFRPHPLARHKTPAILGTKLSTRPFEEDLKDAWAVITYNSNLAVDALIEGIPAFSFDEGSMAYEVTGHSMMDIENPKGPSRQQWFNNLAYAQWTFEEMELGLAWRHIKPAIKVSKNTKEKIA